MMKMDVCVLYIKTIFNSSFLFLLLLCLLASCGGTENNKGSETNHDYYARVKFINESGYDVKIHRGSFYGQVLLELSQFEFESDYIDIHISDNKNEENITFFYEYIKKIWIDDYFDDDNDSEQVSVSGGLDPKKQIPVVLKANKTHTVQIPKPANIEIKTALIILRNAHNMPCELWYGSAWWTSDNNTVIAPGKTGIYKNRYAIPDGGELCKYNDFHVVAASSSVPVPEFLMENGYIHSFRYNGTSVEKDGINWKRAIFIK